MTYKKLILIIVSIIGSLLFAIVGLYLLYRLDPSIIGLENNSKDSQKSNDKTASPAVSHINNKNQKEFAEFNQMQSQLLKNAILKYQNEEIRKQKDYLYDSLQKVTQTLKPAKDSLSMVKDSFKITKNYIKYLNDSLSKLSNMYNSLAQSQDKAKKAKETEKEKPKLTTEQEKKLKARADSLYASNLMSYARIYNNSSPQEVAKILDQLNEKDAAFILKSMNKKRAAKVMESLLPETAAAIMLLGKEK